MESRGVARSWRPSLEPSREYVDSPGPTRSPTTIKTIPHRSCFRMMAKMPLMTKITAMIHQNGGHGLTPFTGIPDAACASTPSRDRCGVSTPDHMPQPSLSTRIPKQVRAVARPRDRGQFSDGCAGGKCCRDGGPVEQLSPPAGHVVHRQSCLDTPPGKEHRGKHPGAADARHQRTGSYPDVGRVLLVGASPGGTAPWSHRGSGGHRYSGACALTHDASHDSRGPAFVA